MEVRPRARDRSGTVFVACNRISKSGICAIERSRDAASGMGMRENGGKETTVMVHVMHDRDPCLVASENREMSSIPVSTHMYSQRPPIGQ